MKRLAEEAQPDLAALSDLLGSAERHQPNPFVKRSLRLRLERALAPPVPRRARRPAWLLIAGLLVAGTAAAAGYAVLAKPTPASAPAVSAPSSAPLVDRAQPRAAAPSSEPVSGELPAPSAAPARERPRERPRAGEDPSQVAEAVRALRKQGDPARAQALLERYLRENPRGALSEDALALAIEAASARKDPRAADYARRYLARYPNGRFRSLAERTLAR